MFLYHTLILHNLSTIYRHPCPFNVLKLNYYYHFIYILLIMALKNISSIDVSHGKMNMEYYLFI